MLHFDLISAKILKG